MELKEDARYTYAVGKIRALESRLLTPDRVQGMLDASDVTGAWREAGGWGLTSGMKLESGDILGEIEEFVSAEMKYTRDTISLLSRDEDLTNLFFVKYDFHNLKVLLKSAAGYRLTERDPEDETIDMGIVSVEQLKKALGKNNLKGLPPLSDITELRIDGLRAHPELIDITLDREMYALILKTIDRYKKSPSYGFLRDLFRTQADIHNLQMLKRIKYLDKDTKYLSRAILDGGKIEKKDLLEYYGKNTTELTGYCNRQVLSCRSHLVRLWESTMYTAFGLEPLIFYLRRREEEAGLIRMIMLARLNNLSGEETKKKVDEIWLTLRQ